MIIDVSMPAPERLELGRQGENEVTTFTFDASAWVAEYGPGELTLVAQRMGDTDPYPVELEENVWTVSSADTAVPGYGEAQLVYTVGEAVKKTVIYTTRVLPSLEGTVPAPDPLETWLEQVLDAKTDAESAANESKGYAQDSKGYADDAKAYAQAAASVFTYTDDGNGNITIARSVDDE